MSVIPLSIKSYTLPKTLNPKPQMLASAFKAPVLHAVALDAGLAAMPYAYLTSVSLLSLSPSLIGLTVSSSGPANCSVSAKPLNLIPNPKPLPFFYLSPGASCSGSEC